MDDFDDCAIVNTPTHVPVKFCQRVNSKINETKGCGVRRIALELQFGKHQATLLTPPYRTRANDERVVTRATTPPSETKKIEP